MTTNMIRTLTLSAAALTLATLAQAQSRGAVEIPFSFKVNGVTMPAGNYEIDRPNSSVQGVLLLTDGRHRTFASGMETPVAGNREAARMIFSCRESSGCSLIQLWDEYGVGVQFSAPKQTSAETERRAVVSLKSASE